MADDHKDRLGDTLRKKEKADEDRYFAEQDRERLERLRSEKEGAEEAARRDAARGRCPKCGTALTARKIGEVEVDQCPDCHGIWLDKGELEALSVSDQETWLGHLTTFLFRAVR